MKEITEQESFVGRREKRISRKEAEAGGRKTVIILFLITIFLSLLFWLKKEIPDLWQKIVTPYKMMIEKGGEK